MAFWAKRFSTVTTKHHTILYLILIFPNHSEKFVNTYTLILWAFCITRQSVPQPILMLLRQLRIRCKYRKIIYCSPTNKFLLPLTHFITMPTLHTPVIYTQRSIWYNKIFIYAHNLTKPLTCRTYPQGGVEREKSITQFLKHHTIRL